MRILFLTNLYPPFSNGGYEQLCQEVAQAFTDRGHEISIITSRVAGKSTIDTDGPVRVYRCLELEVEGGLAQTTLRLLINREASERRNVSGVEYIVESFKPDAALIWGMWNVPKSVPATVERLLPDSTNYYFCDYWPTLPNAYIQRLEEPARNPRAATAKRAVASVFLPRLLRETPIRLRLRRIACVSLAICDYLSTSGLQPYSSRVINNGIALGQFYRPAENEQSHDGPIRLVYAGRLSVDKGLHTAVAAVRLLVEWGVENFTLEVYGDGDLSYIRALQSEVKRWALPVSFYGLAPRSSMPDILFSSDILLFPSIVMEALPRVVMEAMASGLAVVGTNTGGTTELLMDGETGLTFEPGNATDLAHQIARLLNDEDFCEEVAARGQELVTSRFSIESTVDGLESMLMETANESQPRLH